jgi:hypothetical protein
MEMMERESIDRSSPEIDSAMSDQETRPIRRRAVISHIRSGERVHPNSAYHGTNAHTCAMAAKHEDEVLGSFLVISIQKII